MGFMLTQRQAEQAARLLENRPLTPIEQRIEAFLEGLTLAHPGLTRDNLEHYANLARGDHPRTRTKAAQSLSETELNQVIAAFNTKREITELGYNYVGEFPDVSPTDLDPDYIERTPQERLEHIKSCFMKTGQCAGRYDAEQNARGLTEALLGISQQIHKGLQ
tara:strand:- start:64 stop:552 length:489 start_codon:yes stop_codon:yes gene_type:complete